MRLRSNAIAPRNIGSINQPDLFGGEDKEGGIVGDVDIEFVKPESGAVAFYTTMHVAKGSKEPHKEYVGQVTEAQVKQIAELKFKDLNAKDLEGAIRIIKEIKIESPLHTKSIKSWKEIF